MQKFQACKKISMKRKKMLGRKKELSKRKTKQMLLTISLFEAELESLKCVVGSATKKVY